MAPLAAAMRVVIVTQEPIAALQALNFEVHPHLLEGSTLKSSLPTSIDYTDESRFRSWRPSQLDEIRHRTAASMPITTR